jgi:hypothetical protein
MRWKVLLASEEQGWPSKRKMISMLILVSSSKRDSWTSYLRNLWVTSQPSCRVLSKKYSFLNKLNYTSLRDIGKTLVIQYPM